MLTRVLFDAASNIHFGRKDKVSPPKTIYQVIPWEYSSPEDYDVIATYDSKGKKRYVLTTIYTKCRKFLKRCLKNIYNFIAANDFLENRRVNMKTSIHTKF